MNSITECTISFMAERTICCA